MSKNSKRSSATVLRVPEQRSPDGFDNVKVVRGAVQETSQTDAGDCWRSGIGCADMRRVRETSCN